MKIKSLLIISIAAITGIANGAVTTTNFATSGSDASNVTHSGTHTFNGQVIVNGTDTHNGAEIINGTMQTGTGGTIILNGMENQNGRETVTGTIQPDGTGKVIANGGTANYAPQSGTSSTTNQIVGSGTLSVTASGTAMTQAGFASGAGLALTSLGADQLTYALQSFGTAGTLPIGTGSIIFDSYGRESSWSAPAISGSGPLLSGSGVAPSDFFIPFPQVTGIYAGTGISITNGTFSSNGGVTSVNGAQGAIVISGSSAILGESVAGSIGSGTLTLTLSSTLPSGTMNGAGGSQVISSTGLITSVTSAAISGSGAALDGSSPTIYNAIENGETTINGLDARLSFSVIPSLSQNHGNSLVYWWSVLSSGTLTDGATVNLLTDWSANHWTTSGTGTYRSYGMNGMPCIEFSGTTNQYMITSSTNVFSGTYSNGCCLWIVYQPIYYGIYAGCPVADFGNRLGSQYYSINDSFSNGSTGGACNPSMYYNGAGFLYSNDSPSMTPRVLVANVSTSSINSGQTSLWLNSIMGSWITGGNTEILNGPLSFGNTYSGNYEGVRISEIGFMNTAVSPSECQELIQDLMIRWNFPKNKIVLVGDSITYCALADQYSVDLSTLIKAAFPNYNVGSFSWGGHALSDFNSTAFPFSDFYGSLKPGDVAILGLGHNDINNGQSLTQMIANVAAITGTMHATGAKVLPHVIPSGSYTNANSGTLALAYNNALLSGSSGGDDVIDYSRDPRFNIYTGAGASCNNTTYFNPADRVHPLSAAYKIWSDYFINALQKQISPKAIGGNNVLLTGSTMSSGTYSVQPDDYTIMLDPTLTGTAWCVLPSGKPGQQYSILDYRGVCGSGSNAIIITTATSNQTISGTTQQWLTTAYGHTTIIYDGTNNWFIK